MAEDDVATLVARCQFDLNYLTPLKSAKCSSTRTYVLPMKLVAHCFKPGHKIVISISPNNFPMLWPSDKPADVHIYPDFCRFLYPTESAEYLTKHTVIHPPPRPLLQIATVGLISFISFLRKVITSFKLAE